MARHFASDVETEALQEIDEVDSIEDNVITSEEGAVPLGEAVESEEAAEEEEEAEMMGAELPVWLDLLITAVITIAVVLVMRLFVADTYEIPTGSMLDTIQLGDRLVGEKVSYRFRSPAAGEIVTFFDPSDPSITLIKRVIATEGQTVDLVNGSVVVDGVVLEEQYVSGQPSDPINRHAAFLDEDISYPLVVPEGHIWVMGDNRTNSLDSRYFGPVSVDSVSSHAVFIYWPPSDAGRL